MTAPNDRQRQAFEAFKKAWEEYPSQDNEGYVPDRGGFKCGWFAALQWADSTPPQQEGDDSDQVNKFLIWILDHSEIHCSASRNEIINRLYELIAHARRAQNEEVERLKKELEQAGVLIDERAISYDKLQRKYNELRALLEREKEIAEALMRSAPEMSGTKSIFSRAQIFLKDYERMKGKE